ncbi:hypothetical protein K3165_01025 [Qipengyuania sp. 1XM1-15A]|uniref:hypothetical protein n=1 Tax=Qipengyuania xiamenensis TaxID=2867237 RepID=UPI001C878B5A|nr:hypothetical protein [Qipengyuania xiamenensis]MBX7531500.1 hypothetical protein [Qipengyuania xiamenensis]
MRASLAALALSLVASGCAVDGGEIASVSVPAQPAADWRPVDAETGMIADVAGLTALSEAFPDSSSVKLRLLNAQLQAGEGAAMLDTLRWLNERGYVFSEVARGQIPKLIGEKLAQDATALLLAPPDPVEKSEVVWTVPAEAGLVESVLVDVEEGRLAVTSIATRSLWGTTPDGSWRQVELAGADNLTGIVYDRATGDIWVSSGNVDQSEDNDEHFSGLMSGLKGPGGPRVEAPDDVVLSDLHRAEDGTLYASDPLNGGVYFLGPEREAIGALLEPGTLRSPQGLATSEDGKRLYVSDYRYGIAIIDLATREVSRLRSDIPVILDGTDALFRRGNSLIAIQNGTSPMRITQFDLSDDGTRVVGHRILEMAHGEWTEPLGGYLGQNALYYVGNGQWDKYVAGVLGEGKEPAPTQIRRLPLTD